MPSSLVPYYTLYNTGFVWRCVRLRFTRLCVLSSVSPQTSAVSESTNYAFTAAEWRASIGVALLYMLRMFGLFLLLPIFVLEMHAYRGGDQAFLVGLTLGVYGLVQALLQIPLGWASDTWGRKRLIGWGLVLFGVGAALAALADSLYGMMLGRVLQGAGAVGAAMTALLADLTRDAVRTKAMAIVGGSIAMSFALSLVLAPWLAAKWHLSGIFWIMAAAAVPGLFLLFFYIPAEPGKKTHDAQHAAHCGQSYCARPPNRLGLRAVKSCFQPLWRLHLGVFFLHAIQTQFWLLLPQLLVRAGMVKAHHWQLYIASLALALLVMGGGLLRLERKGHGSAVNATSIALLGLAIIALYWLAAQLPLAAQQGAYWPFEGISAFMAFFAVLALFFTGFSMLEASQPSQVSRQVPASQRGLAMGIYNTAQALGLFFGAASGGFLLKISGAGGLLGSSLALCLIWLVLALMQPRTAGPSTDELG